MVQVRVLTGGGQPYRSVDSLQMVMMREGLLSIIIRFLGYNMVLLTGQDRIDATKLVTENRKLLEENF